MPAGGKKGNRGGGRKGHGIEERERKLRETCFELGQKLLDAKPEKCWECDGKKVIEVPNVISLGDGDDGTEGPATKKCPTCKGKGKAPMQLSSQQFDLLKACLPKCLKQQTQLEGADGGPIQVQWVA